MAGKIQIDRELCMGSGQCNLYASKTFGLDDDSVAIVLDENGDSDDAIQLAIDTCPTGAISLAEE